MSKIQYTSHSNNLFYNYGLANVRLYLQVVKGKDVPFDQITFEDILNAAKYYFGFTALKYFGNINNISSKSNSISFEFRNVNEFSGQSTNKRLQHRYIPASVLITDKQEKDLINIWSILHDKEKMQESKNLDLTKSCFCFSSKFLFANYSSQKTPTVTCKEYLCYLIANITPYKPSFMLENVPTAIIPDFELDDLFEWVLLFKQVFNSYVGTNGAVITKINPDNPGKYERPMLNGNYNSYTKVKSSLLRELFLLMDLKENLRKLANKKFEDTLDDIINHNVNNFTFYIMSAKMCVVHKYSHHIAKLSQTGEIKNILTSYLMSYSDAYRDSLVKKEDMNWDDFNRKSFLHERDFYNWACQMTDVSLKKLNSKKINYSNGISHLYKYYFKEVKNMNEQQIDSAMSIAQKIRKKYVAMVMNEINSAKFAGKNPQFVKEEKDRFMKSYLDEFISHIEQKQTPTDLIRMFNKLCRDTKEPVTYIDKTDFVFINDVLTEKIPLRDAKNILTGFIRIQISKPAPTEEKLTEAEASTAA